MKRITQNLLLAVFASLLIFSCGKDDEPTAAVPSVTVSATVDGTAVTSGSEVEAGSSIVITVNITAPGGVNGLDVNGTSYSRTQLGAEAGDTEASITFNAQELGSDLVGSSVVWEVEAVDDAGQVSTTVSFTVDVVSPSVRSYSAVLLAAPTGDFMNKNFFSVSAGMTYSSDDVTSTATSISPTIDFGYYYGTTDAATIASPSGFESTVFSGQVSGWTTKNATTLKTTSLTSSQFTEIATHADIDAAYDAGTTDANGIISGLVVGQVLAFETVDGVRGLIVVSAIEPGTDSNDSITLDVLAQLDASN